ncbi:uncharacterized protein LOC120946033 [Rana temporaria]|uniref:uncharacterized protein LOC120946033 n=1 Tax=Rana temporaria TaxID=8407 RepID=UPI001AACF6FB|nr:uncharacterized protein LOC120946033 [Rana temporaria]XP_040216657.1 uncharacterized protein LOC120946033 [Rana temporaria]
MAVPGGDVPVGGAARRGKDPQTGAGLARSTGGGLARGGDAFRDADGATPGQSRQSGGPASRHRSESGRVDRRGSGAQAAAAVLRDDLIEEFSSDGDESPRGVVAPIPVTTPAVSRGRGRSEEVRQRPHGQAATGSSSSEEGELPEDPAEDGRYGNLSAGGPSRPRRTDPQGCLIWILGHSFVFWGARRADVKPGGRQLGVPREEGRVRWIGIRGLMWQKVLPEVHRGASLDRAPDILVIHAGGNDLSVRPMRQVIKDIQWDIRRLRASFPDLIIVWSDVVARMAWREARSLERLDKARIKVNREVGRFVVQQGGIAVRHSDLEVETWRYLRGDGVHLNPIGIDLWALGLEEGVRRAFLVWRRAQV